MKSPDAALPLPGVAPGPAPAVGFFEYWPGWLFYAPVVAHWLWLGLRHGGLTLPTAANPSIPTGGLCGERKSAILDLVGAPERAAVAPYIVITAGTPAAEVAARLEAAGLDYPLVVKPDIGCNGTGVRLVRDGAALAAVLALFRPEVFLVVQKLVPHAGEAGIFYVREPGARVGRITSVTLKEPPTVIGDGRSSLRDLVLRDPRLGAKPEMYLPRLGARQQEVPAAGAAVRLVFVGNHCKGSTFRDGSAHRTPALAARIEAIARAIPDFHFGRFDVRYASLAELRRGLGFTIIEINGAGSEATHIWDPRTTLKEAYRAQFEHYAAAFRIGAANRARGATPTRAGELIAAFRTQRRLMADYPLND